MSTKKILTLALCLLATAVGCRQNMHNQNKVEPYEASTFFTDGQGSRQLRVLLFAPRDRAAADRIDALIARGGLPGG